MSTAALDTLDTAVVVVARSGAAGRTAADVYAEVAHAWFRLHHPSEHLENPIKIYAVCPGFAQEVWGRPNLNAQRVIAVCARIVSVDKWALKDGQQTAGCGKLTEALDPVTAWWQPLGDADVLGVHYWRLASGIIEFRDVATVDKPPELQFGRFLERQRRREEVNAVRIRRGALRSARR